MKERQILFNAEMVRAILEGRKTQTRRVVKPQPELLYSVTGDKIEVVYNSGALYGFYFPKEWGGITPDSRITKLGLYGGVGWQYLLADTIQRLREKGFCGLVSVAGSRNKKGVLECIALPRKQKSDEISSPLNLHGFSRDARAENTSNETHRRSSIEQQTEQSDMGNPISELGGQGGARERNKGRETSNVEIDGQGARASALGVREGALQPTPCSKDAWNVPGCNVKFAGFREGLRLWVREAFALEHQVEHGQRPPHSDGRPVWVGDRNEGPAWIQPHYRATDPAPELSYEDDDDDEPRCKWKPSIHMPRWASRITLKITDVRVERLQDISDEDSLAEGIYPTSTGLYPGSPRTAFRDLWISVYGEDSWVSDPWVWVIEFKEVK